jgi:hypothetical protein
MTMRGLGIGSPMRSARFLVLVALATVVMTAWIGPSTARAARLRYQAPERCPSRTRFAEEVTARLGFSPWSTTGSTLHVRIRVENAAFVGSLSPDPTAEPRRFAADSCRKVTDLLVTAAASALDRREAPSAPPAPQSAAAPPAPRTAAARPADGAAAPARRATSARNVRREAAKPTAAATAKPARRTAAAAPPPAAPASNAPADPMSAAALPPAALQWSFADRNNRFQAGLIFVSYAGFGVTGTIPLGKGHVQATYARSSSDSQFGDSVNAQAHAYYLYPFFYINRDSAFEVPVFAGGGLGYQSYSFDQTMGEDTDETAIMPTVAAATAIQFRAFPVEFLSEMTVSFVKAPVVGQHVGFNFAIRYVFGRD